jgi:hypothetical protein
MHRQPGGLVFIIASCVSLGGSLLADFGLVTLGITIFPATKGYVHFRFGDYGELTTVGVVVACIGWTVVTRISASPRWLFFRLAILTTLVLWLPDIWLLTRHEPLRAVITLMAMHLAIALITYNCLVHIAGLGPNERTLEALGEPMAQSNDCSADESAGVPLTGTLSSTNKASIGSHSWIAMSVLVGLEFAFGIAALVLVPVGRPSEWVPNQGRGLYLVHGCLGAVLVAGAVILCVSTVHADRIARIAALSGLIGIALGAGGGALSAYHSTRLIGMGLMLFGALVAGFGYLVPLVEPEPHHRAS